MCDFSVIIGLSAVVHLVMHGKSFVLCWWGKKKLSEDEVSTVEEGVWGEVFFNSPLASPKCGLTRWLL